MYATQINVQIVLNETSNIIQFNYEYSNTSNADANKQVAIVGLKGDDSTDFFNRTTTSDWTSTTTTNDVSSGCIFSHSVLIPNGLTFTWTPGVNGTSEPIGDILN